MELYPFSPSNHDAIKLPGFGLPLAARRDLKSFREGGRFPTALDSSEDDPYKAPLLTVREYTMMNIMNRVTDKYRWHEKIYNEAIVAKIKAEAIAAPNMDISRDMIDWCMEELKYKALLSHKYSCVETLDGVFKSDTIISESMRIALIKGVNPLEDVAEEEKDWHPSSHKKVLDLVHPSIYPLVYGQTRILPEGVCDLDDCLRRCGEGRQLKKPALLVMKDDQESTLGWSTLYQWLPSEFETPRGSKDVVAKSYINNLHPQRFKELYRVIEFVIAKAIPLWDLTLTCLVQDLHPNPRIAMQGDGWNPPANSLSYGSKRDDAFTIRQQWLHNRTVKQPEPGDYRIPVDGLHNLQEAHSKYNQTRVDLREEFGQLQIIVKLANIELTPEKPEYAGGSWHVEGMANESICASALYYYDCENITESYLAFRQAVATQIPGWEYAQDDHHALETIYGFKNGQTAFQPLGEVATRQSRLLTFPNVMQHRVSPFRLADSARPGHRKLLALFLVDPHLRIISTANVPCQQRSWWQDEALEDATLRRPQAEQRNQIPDDADQFPISLDKAKEQRHDLMIERKDFVTCSEGGFVETATFSLCEH